MAKIPAEIGKYKIKEQIAKGGMGAVYKAVHPGLTGMWQVSGRSDTTYKERVDFDLYYVRNWSIWLDFYILLRTVWVVVMQVGAR